MFRVLSLVIMCLVADFIIASSRVHDQVNEKQSPSTHADRKSTPKPRPHSRHTAKPNLRASAISGKVKSTTEKPPSTPSNDTLVDSPCTCAVFLSGQFVRGSRKPPTGYPPISADLEDQFSCDSTGVKLCLNRCVDKLYKFIPKAADVICDLIDRDCFKERAHLFVKNCRSGWVNTNLSAGREYCCKNGVPYKCPLV